VWNFFTEILRNVKDELTLVHVVLLIFIAFLIFALIKLWKAYSESLDKVWDMHGEMSENTKVMEAVAKNQEMMIARWLKS